MRSVRLDAELETHLKEASRITGEPISAIIRDAIRRRCNELLSSRLPGGWADYVGAFAGGRRPSVARKTGKAFTELLKRRAKTKR